MIMLETVYGFMKIKLTCLSEIFDLDGTLLIPVVVADFAVPLYARIPFPPELGFLVSFESCVSI